MKLKLGQLSTIDLALGELITARDGRPVKMPVRTSFWIGKFITKLNEELRNYNTARENLMKTYCLRHPETNALVIEDNTYQFSDENKPIVEAEFNKLVNETVKIPWTPLKLEDLGQQIEVAPQVLMGLMEVGFLKYDGPELVEEKTEENTEKVAE
jgi:hypothetical protein